MVKWYKDGKEITASKKFTMEDKGKLHKLVASAVTKEDEGIYTCKIGDDTLIFDLKVSGKFVIQVWHQSMLETQDLVHYTCLLPFFFWPRMYNTIAETLICIVIAMQTYHMDK